MRGASTPHHQMDPCLVRHADVDPVPAQRALATRMREYLREPGAVAALRSLRGYCVVPLPGSDRRVRVRVAGDGFTIARLPRNAELADLDEPQDAAVAHWLAQVMAPRVSTWQGAADRFWDLASTLSGAPSALVVVATDGSPERRLGDPQAEPYEVHGSPESLVKVFSGDVLLIDAASSGAVQIVGTLPQLSVLSGACMTMQIGDW